MLEKANEPTGEGLRAQLKSAEAEVERLRHQLRARDHQLRERSQQLRARDEQLDSSFALLSDSIPDMLAVVDQEHRYLHVNVAYARMRNNSPHDLVGKTIREVLPAADYDKIIGPLRSALAGEPQAFEFSAGGRVRWVDVLPRRAVDKSVTSALCLIRDVTAMREAEIDRRDLEQQLHHAQKMEAVGRLAGGLAHDFNNLLAVVRCNTDLALERTTADAERRELLDEVQRAVQQAAHLTRQLVSFSRRDVVTPAVVDPNAVVAELQPMLSRLLGDDLKVDVQLLANDPAVLIDPVQLKQAVLNLVINARDAMPEGGTLTLSTEEGSIDGRPAVHIAVRDRGTGIADHHLDRIFEAFFTTKGPGRGTGLGLATTHGIVLQNGGLIDVESTLGEGSTFTIRLPRATGKRQASAPPPPPSSVSAHGERVLVVEDNHLVRKAAERLLSRLGYRTLTAATPLEALAVAAEHDFDVLLTDLDMPEMSGYELAAKLLEKSPDLGVVYSSGHVLDHELHQQALARGGKMLPKPYSREDIAEVIRAALRDNNP